MAFGSHHRLFFTIASKYSLAVSRSPYESSKAVSRDGSAADQLMSAGRAPYLAMRTHAHDTHAHGTVQAGR